MYTYLVLVQRLLEFHAGGSEDTGVAVDSGDAEADGLVPELAGSGGRL